MIFFSAFVLSAVAFAYEEYAEWMHELNHSKWDFREKIASVFHRASLLIVGLTYPYGLAELLFFLVIYWTLTDGLQNIFKRRNFFAISEGTMNPIERFSTWYIKLGLFIISIFIMKGA